MLTKSDFDQLRVIISEQIRAETPNIVREIIQEETPKIVRVIVREEIAPLKRDVSKIKKDIKIISSFFDREIIDLSKRVTRIEDYTGVHAD